MRQNLFQRGAGKSRDGKCQAQTNRTERSLRTEQFRPDILRNKKCPYDRSFLFSQFEGKNASAIKRVDEMKNFVSSELRNLKEQQKQLELHIFACEHILKGMGGANERFGIEQAIVRGEFEDQKVSETLLKLIASKCNHWVVLQIACLWSLRSQGLKSKFYRQFQETFLHRYGFEKLAVLYKLRQHFLLTEKENAIVRSKALPFLGKNANGPPLVDEFKPTQSFAPLPNVISALRLCPPHNENERKGNFEHKAMVVSSNVEMKCNDKEKDDEERKRRNLAYVFSDAYIPLISNIVHGTVTNVREKG
ncbi:hypothetical protein niasHT_005009 [Heterodera trifolii]|uniref:Uncharacterized protein n=1 Tax=Heterodera trifolii TaxID=157864 RepID=A0ABD2M0B5_9BILA